MLTKTKPIRSQKLRDSARGEDCTLNIEGVCNYDPATTVLSHLPDESHGGSRKSDDHVACYGCSSCHGFIDGSIVKSGRLRTQFQEMSEWFYRRAQNRTLRRMIEKGLIKIA